jgi:hypothetical protein
LSIRISKARCVCYRNKVPLSIHLPDCGSFSNSVSNRLFVKQIKVELEPHGKHAKISCVRQRLNKAIK